MDTYEFLDQIGDLRARIRRLELEIETLNARAEGVSSARFGQTKVLSSHAENRLDAILDLLRERVDEYAETIILLNEQIDRITAEIARLEDIDEAECLTLRYVHRLPWKDISEIMGISERHLRRVRDRGVGHLAAKLENAREDPAQPCAAGA